MSNRDQKWWKEFCELPGNGTWRGRIRRWFFKLKWLDFWEERKNGNRLNITRESVFLKYRSGQARWLFFPPGGMFYNGK